MASSESRGRESVGERGEAAGGGPLRGRRIAVLATDGFEQVELVEPVRALDAAGAQVDIVSLEAGEIQGMNHDEKGDLLPVDCTVDEARAGDYDGLLIPGGVANPDRLRCDEKAVALVRDFIERDKPVAAICHGPWLLVEAGVVHDRTLTSWPSLRTDITNAGGNWEDREVVKDGGLVTSRKPADIPAFNHAMVEEFAEGFHDGQRPRQRERDVIQSELMEDARLEGR